jgi:hypothetical protein
LSKRLLDVSSIATAVLSGTGLAAHYAKGSWVMIPSRDPDTNVVRAEVSKSAKKLQEQRELLLHRLFAARMRLNLLEAQLHENGKNFKDKN